MANLLPFNTSYAGTTKPVNPATRVSPLITKGLFGAKPATSSPQTLSVGQIDTNAPLGQSFEKSGSSAIPTDYTIKGPGGTQVTPPVGTKFANLSTMVGGGQYITNPTDTGAVYKTERPTTTDASTRGIITQGLNSAFYQVDHIVPLWIGGADTEENKQNLYWKDHEKKNVVNEVARSLYNSGKISSKEALAMCINWADKDTSGVDMSKIQSGLDFVPLNVAEAKAKEWTSTPKVGFMDVVKEVPTAWGKVVDAVSPPIFTDFMKGFTSGATQGIVNPSADTNYDILNTGKATPGWEKAIGNTARFAGTIAGGVSSFIFAKGLLGKAAGAIAGATRLGTTVTGAATAAESVFKAEGAATTFWKMKKTGEPILAISRSLLKPIIADVTVSNLLGQIAASGNPDSNRLKQVFVDTANGIVMNVMPKGVKGSLGTAFGGYVTSYIQTGDVDESLKSGAIFGTLHAMGSIKTGGTAKFNEMVETNAKETFVQHRDSILARAGQKSEMPPPMTATPEVKKAYALKLASENRIIDDELTKAVARGEMEPTDWIKERSKVILETEYLNGSVQAENVKAWETQKDTLWEAVNNKYSNKTMTPGVAQNLPEAMVRYVETNPDEFAIGAREVPLPDQNSHSFLADLDTKPYMDFRVRPVGQGVESTGGKILEGNTLEAIQQMSTTQKPINAWVVEQPELQYLMTKLEGLKTEASIADRTTYKNANPQNNLAVVGEVNGNLKVLGYIPSKETIGTVKFNAEGKPELIAGVKQSQNAAAIAKGFTEEWRFLDDKTNKDSITDVMKANGVKSLKVEVEMPTDAGAGMGIGVESNKPYLIIRSTPNLWKESVVRNFDVPNSSWFVSVDKLRNVANLAKERISSPVETIKSLPLQTSQVLPGDLAGAANARFTNGIEVSRNGVTSYLDEVKTALDSGDARVLKSKMDDLVGKDVVTMEDAQKMIAMKNDLLVSDFLPTGGVNDDIITAGMKKGKLSDSGLGLLNSFRFMTRNDSNFYKAWDDIKNRSLTTNRLVDPLNISVDAKTAKMPTSKVLEQRALPIQQRMAETVKRVSNPKVYTKPSTVNPEVTANPSRSVVSEGKTPVLGASEAKKVISATPKVSIAKNAVETGKTAVESKPVPKVTMDNVSDPVAQLPEEKIRVASKAPKKALESFESPDTIGVIPEEKLLQDSKWSDLSNGVMKKPYDAITLAQQKALKAGDSELVKSLQEDKSKFTKFNFELKAKRLLVAAKGDSEKAFVGMKDDLNKYFKEKTGKDLITSYVDEQDLRHNFNRWTDAINDYTVRLTPEGKIVHNGQNITVLSRGDEYARNYEKANKLPEDSLQIISLDSKGSDFGKVKSDIERKNIIRDSLKKEGYVVFGTKANNLDSVIGVKMNPELVKTYDANPGRYEMALDDGAKMITPEDKFFRVFARDVLKMPKSITADGIAKRWNLIFNRNVADKSNSIITKFIMPSPKLSEVGEGLSKEMMSDPEQFANVAKKSVFDGAIYRQKEGAAAAEKANGFPDGKKHFKTSSYHSWDLGEGNFASVIEKGDTVVMTDALKKRLEDMYGVNFAKEMEGFTDPTAPAGRNKFYDVTFGDNVKVGNTELEQLVAKGYAKKISTPHGDGYIVQMPSEAMNYKFISEPSSQNRMPPAAIGKFSAADGVTPEIVGAYKENFDQFKALVDKAGSSKTELAKVFKEYKDYFGLDLENLYGVKGKLVELGAGPKYMQRELSDILKNTFAKKVMDLQHIPTSHMYAKPDMGYVVDGKTKFLKPGEVMISAEKAADLNVKDGDSLLMYRNPISRKTAMVKTKVLIAENKGVDYLGRDHVITSHHDVSVRLEGDYDGDTINFMKVGGKDGLNSKIADVIENKRAAEKDIVLPPLGKFAPKNLTVDNLNGIIDNQLLGLSGTGISAATAREMTSLVDNNVRIVLGKSVSGTDTPYEIFTGDNLVDKGNIKTRVPITGKTEVAFAWDQPHEYMVTKTMQEAVDAIKSPDLAAKGFDNRYLSKRVVNVTGPGAKSITDTDPNYGVQVLNDAAVNNLLNKKMFQYHSIFQLSDANSTASAKDMQDLVERLGSYNANSKNVLKGGGELSPIQEVAQLGEGLKWNKVTGAERFKAYENAGAALKDELAPTMAPKMESKNVQDYIAEAKKAKQDYNEGAYQKASAKSRKEFGRAPNKAEKDAARAEARDGLLKFFYKNKSKYTQDDLDAIVYWNLTDEAGNIADYKAVQNAQAKRGLPVPEPFFFLLDEVLPESPAVTKRFFEHFEG